MLKAVVAPVVMATAASCGLPSESCACTRLGEAFVGVAGTVTDEEGTPLEGVAVTLIALDPTCQDPFSAPYTGATDTAGFYEVGASGGEEGTEACGEIEALRALTDAVDTVRATIDLTYGFEPPDTLDLVFPTR